MAHEGPRLAHLLDVGAAERPLDPMQICEAAHRCLTELSPHVLLVDDLQWLDELSLGLVHYLIRGVGAAGSAMALVVAGRPGPRAAAFTSSLARVNPDPGRIHRISIGPLDRADGARLCQSVNPALGPDEADQIWEQSAGLPFWLLALSRAGSDESGIRALLVGGLASVSADAAALAAVLAVHAKPASPAMLGEVLEWPPARFEGAADELVGLGVALRTGVTLRLTHDLVRAAVLADLPGDVALRAHARLAEHLLEGAGDDAHLLSEVLWHRRAAALPCADLALRLTRCPRRRLLSADDVRALARLASDPHEPQPGSAELRWQVARLASEIGNPALSLETWSELIPHVRSPQERARAALEASRAALELGDRKQARSFLTQSRATAAGDPLLVIEIDAHESEVEGNSRAESEQPMRRAVAAARALPGDGDGRRASTLVSGGRSSPPCGRSSSSRCARRLPRRCCASPRRWSRRRTLWTTGCTRCCTPCWRCGHSAVTRRPSDAAGRPDSWPCGRRFNRQPFWPVFCWLERCTTLVGSPRPEQWQWRWSPSPTGHRSSSRVGCPSRGCGPSCRRLTCPFAGWRCHVPCWTPWHIPSPTRTSGYRSGSRRVCGPHASGQPATRRTPHRASSPRGATSPPRGVTGAPRSTPCARPRRSPDWVGSTPQGPCCPGGTVTTTVSFGSFQPSARSVSGDDARRHCSRQRTTLPAGSPC